LVVIYRPFDPDFWGGGRAEVINIQVVEGRMRVRTHDVVMICMGKSGPDSFAELNNFSRRHAIKWQYKIGERFI
jgi:hypothetical protein